MLWVVGFICTLNSCSLPDPGYNPANAFYMSKESCEQRLIMARLNKSSGIEWFCEATDAIGFSNGEFYKSNSIMVKPQ